VMVQLAPSFPDFTSVNPGYVAARAVKGRGSEVQKSAANMKPVTIKRITAQTTAVAA
jgi:hypothetical protein